MYFEWISEQTERVYSTVQTEYLNTIEANLSIYSTKRPVFDPRPVRVRLVAYKVALGQDILRVLRFYPVGIIPPIRHANLHPHVALTRRTNGQSLVTEENKALL